MAGRDQDGVVVSESLFVALAIITIVLLAALLPTIGLFEGFGLSLSFTPGELFGMPAGGENGMGGMVEGPGGGAPNGSNGTGIGLPGGSGDLSTPPEQTQINGEKPEGGKAVPLFVAKETSRQYWRQSAYMTYTGTGWQQTTRNRPLASGVPNAELTKDDEVIDYQIELLTETQSLPTAWQPARVTVVGVSDPVGLKASTVGGISSENPLESGTTYEAVSHKPPDTPETLRQTSREYPGEIRATYTQLPAETPDRVDEFTTELTADSPTAYDTAVTVREWLKTNKAYDLDTPINTSRPIADQFIFEVDRGYCQHFATTMVVMLRSQGIPARYVVGYAPGSEVGNQEYLVTSDDGHAWVEVYFENIGWVTFEPTPGSGSESSPPQPPYNISLNRSAVAGAPVTIEVAKNGSPVVGAPVYLQGERISWADENGEVTTRLPYTGNVTIVARVPGSEKTDSKSSQTVDSVSPIRNVGIPPLAPETNRQYAVEPVTPMRGISTQPVSQASEVTINQSVENYTADTNVTIDMPESAMVGDRVSLSASIRDIPLRNGTVTLGGDVVAETDTSGQAEFTLTNVSAGERTVSVDRGEVTGTTTLFVTEPPDDPENESDGNETQPETGEEGPRPINVSVSTPFDFPVPFGPGTVTVNNSAGPVAGALVTVDGVPINHTDANGTVSIQLPLSNSATVVATSTAGMTATTKVENLYRNAAILLAGVGLFLGIVALVNRRLGLVDRLNLSRLVELGWVVLDEFLRVPLAITDAGRRFYGYLLTQLETLRSRSFNAWITNRDLTLGTIGNRLIGGLKRFINRIVTGVLGLITQNEENVDEQGIPGDESKTAMSVADLWRDFLAIIQPPQISTWTPGEIGRYAVNRGFPRRPVSKFVTWYREVRYRPDQPVGGVEQAQEQVNAIKDVGEDE